jgi:hypothetical protein
MIISFLYNVLWIVICPFVIFHFTFVLSVLWFTASDYPYGIIKLFSLKHVMFSVEENKQRVNINNNILLYYFLYDLVIKLPNFVLKKNSQNTVSVHMIIIQTKLIHK